MGKPVRAILAALTVAALLAAPVAMAQQASGDKALQRITVRVLPQAEVYGKTFTLGEIAEMDGFDVDVLSRLAQVELGRSPLPGRAMRLSASWLAARLRGEVDPDRLDIRVPDEAQVVRGSQTVSARRIRELVLERARKDAPTQGDTELTIRTAVRDVVLPKGKVDWRIEPVGPANSNGNRTYRVAATVQGQRAWQGIVGISQDVRRQVVVLTEAVAAGEPLRAEQLSTVERDAARMREKDYIAGVDAAVGQVAARDLRADTVLRKALLETPVDLEEGDKVTILFAAGGVRLTVPGVAMVQAKRGDFIPARNLQSGKIVYGTLEAGDMLKVN